MSRHRIYGTGKYHAYYEEDNDFNTWKINPKIHIGDIVTYEGPAQNSKRQYRVVPDDMGGKKLVEIFEDDYDGGKVKSKKRRSRKLRKRTSRKLRKRTSRKLRKRTSRKLI